MNRHDDDPVHAMILDLLEMVSVLHARGYQRLRISPGMSPSGMAWRCEVTHRGNIRRDDGAFVAQQGRQCAIYTSAADRRYFDWNDAAHDDPDLLADKFVERFPDIVAAGRGEDRDYVTWYETMLDWARRGAIPIAYDDEPECDVPGWMRMSGPGGGLIPAPPGGDAEPE